MLIQRQSQGGLIPRSALQNQALRDHSRGRIIEHALQLFGQFGYDRTTIRMIAESAEISQGLIYRHFESKDALLQAIFEQSMQDVRASFVEAETCPPGERLERLIRASFEIIQENTLFWRLSYGVRMQAAVLEALGDQTQSWMQEIRLTLKRYLQEAGVAHPDVEAVILFALIDGVCQHYVLDPERYPLARITERIVDAYR
ncbi:MAG: TetR/AcrR family transcriptional regulator [Longimicrobiales bacterium]